MTFTDAEARVTKEMEEYVTGDFEVVAEKRAQYSEVVFNGGDLYFLVKYNLITIDEVTMKERRKALYVLFQEENIDRCKEHAREHMSGCVCDYEIESIKETKILDVFMSEPPE